MRLELVLNSSRVCYGEPVVARFLFSDEAAARRCPADPSSGPFTTLRLSRETGELVAEADGFTCDQRLGLPVVPGGEKSMPVGELPAGVVFEWTSDLLSYFAVPGPGRYLLSARFVFPPSGIDVRSEPAPLEIVSPDVRRMDVLVDRSALPIVHMIQQHGPGLGARTVAVFRSMTAPGTPWSGITFHDAPSAEARVSMTTFATSATFIHDFRRWVAWIDGRELVLGRYREREIDVLVRCPAPGDGPITLIGRPFQHEDLGVTVLVEERAGAGAHRLHRLDFSAQGALSSRTEVPLPEGARAADAECDREGAIHLLARGAASASLWHIELPAGGSARVRLLLGDARAGGAPDLHRWIRLRIVGKPPLSGRTAPGRAGPTVLAAGVFEHEGACVLLAASVALAGEGEGSGEPPPWHAGLWDLAPLLARDDGAGRDALAAVDLCSNERSEVEIVAVSARGRVWRLVPGAISRLNDVAPAAVDQVKIVRLGDRTAVFFLDAALGFRFQTFGSSAGMP